MICQSQLTEKLQSLLPSVQLSEQASEVLSVAALDSPIVLAGMSIPGTLQVLRPDYATVLALGTDYSLNYINGTVTPLSGGAISTGEQLVVLYQQESSTAWLGELIDAAVCDLSARLPRRRAASVVAMHGALPLPPDFQRLVEVDGASAVAQVVSENCNIFRCGKCNLYVDAGWLIADPAFADGQVYEICYSGGYQGEYDEEADEICYPHLDGCAEECLMLKAQALAYASPKLGIYFTASSSVTTTISQSVAAAGAGGIAIGNPLASVYELPAGGLIEHSYRIGDEQVSKRWANNDDSSSSSTSSSSGLTFSNLKQCAAYFENLYLSKIKAQIGSIGMRSRYCAPSLPYC